MTRYFADTFYFLALVNDRDEAHELAALYAAESDADIVTTEWVLTEFADAVSSPRSRKLFADLLDDCRTCPDIRIVASPELFKRGCDLYLARPDKEWSLTDCISFVVMTDEGIAEALTGDHHFEQAGFVSLLKSDAP